MTDHSPPEDSVAPGTAAGGGRFTRRSLLRGGLLTGAGAVAGGLVGGGAVAAATTGGSAQEREPFWGAHQGGVATASQGHIVLAAFDLTTAERADVITILKAWTSLAAAATAGQAI